MAPTETDAQKAEREAAEQAQQDKGSVEEQASISTTSDENGATKGYIGEDAADVIAKVSNGDTDDLANTDVRTALSAAVAAAPATYAEPVPPGGHPKDPTSTTSVGAAAPGGTAADGGTDTE